jgi:endoglucanase
MYAIIDFHQLSPGDPMSNLDNAKTYFEHMASTHGSKGHVIYEICNEPNGSGVNWARIKTYADQIIPIIRKHDTKSPILVGTPGWSSLGVSGGGPWTDIANNPVSDANALYVFHFYAASHGDSYRNAVTAASARLPLFVSEFGTQTASGDGNNDWNSSRAWMTLMAQKKISWVNWNFSDDNRSGAVLNSGTCPNGPWKAPALKPAGDSIFKWMSTPDQFGGGTPIGPGKTGMGLPDEKVSVEKGGSWLKVSITTNGDYALSLRTLDGKAVAEFKGQGPKVLEWATEGFAPGMYLLNLELGGGEKVRKRVVF